MNLLVNVHGSPYASQSALSAYRFTEAAVAAGHTIIRVFFYHDGVRTADGLAVTAEHEFDLQAAWASLHAEHDVELSVCIAAALKRGILDDDESARYGRVSASLHPAFQLVGLGQLIDGLITADRTITFGA